MVQPLLPPPALSGSGPSGRKLFAFLSACLAGSPFNCVIKTYPSHWIDT